MTRVRSLRPAHPHAATVGHYPLAVSVVYAQPKSKVVDAARLLLFLSVFWLLWVAFAPAAQASSVYIPVIQQSGAGVSGNDGSQPCQLSETEQGLAAILVSHPDQGRNPMICDPILARVARERAADMANRNYFGHVNPDGYGPNYMVRQGGYDLPDLYGNDPKQNMVESIAMGFELTTGDMVWNKVWKDSPVHREHLLGLNSFYAGQQRYGIGHYVRVNGDEITNYWVFIAAHPPQP